MSDIEQKIEALDARVAFLENRGPASPMSVADQKTFMQAVGQFILDQIAPLKARIAELETNRQRFCGVHQRALEYRRGDIVMHNSAAWIAIDNVGVNQVPDQSTVWQLYMKGPRQPAHRNAQPP
jgi:hypothetical protein